MPSLAVIELTDMVPEEEKKELLLNHLSYIFTLGAAGKDRADLSTWSRDYYFHVWGFISPIYFYFWFLYLGPVIYALLVNFYSQIYQKMIHIPPKTFWQRAKYILSIYFVCNVARWYAYGPMALLRGMFVCFVIFSTIWGSVFMLEMCTHKKQGDILI